MKAKENILKFDRPSADVFRQVDLVVGKGGIPDVAPFTLRRKYRPTAAMLAFAGLLVAAVAAGADESAQTAPTAARPATGGARMQPTANQFAPPNQPDVSAGNAGTVDELYRLLIGPRPATGFGSRRGTTHSGAEL